MNKEFDEILFYQLEEFDEYFAEKGVLLPNRPVQAASMFMKHCVSYVKNIPEDKTEKDVLDNMLLEVHSKCSDWYRNKYGDKFTSIAGNYPLSGVFLFRGVPYELVISKSIKSIDYEKKLMAVCFPNEVMPNEKYEDFFEDSFDIGKIGEKDGNKILDSVEEIVRFTRAASVNLMFANLKEERGMADTVFISLNKAVSDIVKSKDSSLKVALWELLLSVEKMFKLYLAQKGSDYPKNHKIKELLYLAREYGLKDVEDELICIFPDFKEVIDLRYGNGDINIIEVFNCYLATIEIMFKVSEQLEATVKSNNAIVYLKIPE